MQKPKKQPHGKQSKGRESKDSQVETQEAQGQEAQVEMKDRGDDYPASFALATDGHVYIHESELPPEKQRGRKEWRGVRLTRQEAEVFADELHFIIPNVAIELAHAIRQGRIEEESAAPKAPEGAEPVNTGGSTPDPETA
ncbi:hypothetical protein [Polyangium aurulentum]|uniref:hypothetical protein n=1 Tax=Polyangium aurulentum TaxID=2567896 RepID=UPI0010AEC693|nr:hypothetical protein [Polyangium aurulentum]UQA57119.1 hypothetical protein E8A73_038385 [Polyangium aurulentum]